MQLTQHTDFGLRVLMYLGARPDDRLTTAEIADVLGVPRNHLQKVVQRLSDLGWVEARPGPSGGIRFAPEAREVRIGDVIRSLESHLAIVECMAPKNKPCPLQPMCGLAPLLQRARDAFLAQLDAVTLGDLVPRSPENLPALGETPRITAVRTRSAS